MDIHPATTPFGRRAMTLGMIAAQRQASRCPADARVGKWPIFRAACEAKAALGLGDRALAVLNALLTFFPADELAAERDLVVFPSNRQLSLRAHGMAPATLRRHLGVLVEAGLVIRRDSPNGKRYARKGEGGEIDLAFGFDLRPLVARSAEIEAAADDVRRTRQEVAAAREVVTLLRRDIVKMMEAGMDLGLRLDWDAMTRDYAALARRLPRTPDLSLLRELGAAFGALAQILRNALEAFAEMQNPSGNESQTERHKQNSNPDPTSDLEPRFEQDEGAKAEPEPARLVAGREAGGETQRGPRPNEAGQGAAPRTYPLGLVLRACPDLVDYARQGISDWRDLVATAALVRPMLGISPDAFERAREVMGEIPASIVVAAILQRGDAINSAGGYLRSLTRKAELGEFSLGPVLMALVARRTRAEEARMAV